MLSFFFLINKYIVWLTYGKPESYFSDARGHQDLLVHLVPTALNYSAAVPPCIVGYTCYLQPKLKAAHISAGQTALSEPHVLVI